MIRKASPKDIAEICYIVCACYEGFAVSDNYSQNVVAELKELRGSADCIKGLITNELVYISYDSDMITGMISIEGNEITKLYIHPEHQKKGIGAQLFKHAETVIQSFGFSKMHLCAAGQSAVPFYKKMGMTVSQKRMVDCGPCVGMTAIILEKNFEI